MCSSHILWEHCDCLQPIPLCRGRCEPFIEFRAFRAELTTCGQCKNEGRPTLVPTNILKRKARARCDWCHSGCTRLVEDLTSDGSAEKHRNDKNRDVSG
jgi:hypothetical protein